jgi:hypothetical protein
MYKAGILRLILYGCESSFLTLGEEHILRVFEDRVLRSIFGSKRDEMIGSWRKLHNAELHSFCYSTSVIRMIKSGRMRWTGHVAYAGEKRNECRILAGKPGGKNHEEDLDIGGRIILTDLREIGWGGVDWIDLTVDREQWRAFVTTAMNRLLE